MAPPPPRRPPALMEELVEEVLLRFPPDDPASLVRAALVSKRWCLLISGCGFRRRFRELHRAPPLLGFVCNVSWNSDDGSPDNARFVPTSSCLRHADRRGWRALDARHGRVLLYHCIHADDIITINFLDPFVVWDPISDEQLQLSYLPAQPLKRFYPPWPVSFNATVLCAGGDACDHLDCHRGHFLVVFVGIDIDDGIFVYVYSSEAGVWSEPTIAHQHPVDDVDLVPAALVGNAVYFVFRHSTRILKYDLATREISLIDMPSTSYGRILLFVTHEGRLGFTRADDDFKLYLMSMEVGAQDGVVWTQDRVIELENLLPADALLSSLDVAGYVNGLGAIFIGTEDGFFIVDPKSNHAMKVGGVACMKDGDVDRGDGHDFYIVVPYTSFYFPALQADSVAVGPSVGASSA